MGSFSIWHWIVVLLIVLLLFGAGKLPTVMGDIAKGIKAFKAGLKDPDADETPAAPPPAATVATTQPASTVTQAAAQPAPAAASDSSASTASQPAANPAGTPVKPPQETAAAGQQG